MRGSDTIVDVIDEAYDTLGLNDEEAPITKLDRAGTKRNGRNSPMEAAAGLGMEVESVEIIEIEVEATE
jgi:hypothetical protein